VLADDHSRKKKRGGKREECFLQVGWEESEAHCQAEQPGTKKKRKKERGEAS